MLCIDEIRSGFLNYFCRNDHSIVPSGPLVPPNDPTLLFTNSGMVQFKNIFTGVQPSSFPRAVSVQKCIRAGGKHNDLENVGYTTRHHTFFEMLGNFSFGDYFKEKAILLAWNLLTQEFGLPPEKLLVTVHERDLEAADLWRKIAGLPEERIISLRTGDNFWQMADLGPCGPCSEIFYDHGDHLLGGPPGSCHQEGERFVEIWNLVFMQYEQVTREKRIDLPCPCVDTGMGLERIVAVLEGSHDNYDTHIFRPLILACEELARRKAEGQTKTSYRVIADHLRAAGFLISEGVFPSNEGRGYVLRRILRRAMRYAFLSGFKEPVLHRLVSTLVQSMGNAWPELVERETVVREEIYQEELRFLDMLSRGLTLLAEEISHLGQGSVLHGEIVFKLYDTYGFPTDLTADVLRQKGISLDLVTFDAAMERQKNRSRLNRFAFGEAFPESIWFDLHKRYGSTLFAGYEDESLKGRVLALVYEGAAIPEASQGQEIGIIVDKTPFYAESGGQKADYGQIFSEDRSVLLDIVDVQKRADGLFVHLGKIVQGSLKQGDSVILQIDHDHRMRLCANHGATHLLHASLRRFLGVRVTQKGSLVAHDYLRFDFSHPGPVSSEILDRTERLMNEVVLAHCPVTVRLMKREEATAEGALALFGEKYSSQVRVVSVGALPYEDQKYPFSMELCGGTHVHNTSRIGFIRIVSESPVSSGVRRIEALTGEFARCHLDRQERSLKSVAEMLKVPPVDVLSRVENLLHERKSMEREIAAFRRKNNSREDLVTICDECVGDIVLRAKKSAHVLPGELRMLAEEEKKSLASGVLAIFSEYDKKVSVVISVTQDLTSKFHAADLVRKVSLALGGQGGGGRPDMAQGGGPEGSHIPFAVNVLKDILYQGR